MGNIYIVTVESRGRDGTYSISFISKEKCQAFLVQELKDRDINDYPEELEVIDNFSTPFSIVIDNATTLRVTGGVS